MKQIIYTILIIPLLFLVTFTKAQAGDLSAQNFGISNSKYYQIGLDYEEGKLIYTSLMVRRGEKEINNSSKEARAELYSFSAKKLVATNLDLPKKGKEGILEIPYFSHGREIKILNNSNNDELLTINVSSFADTCGDGICQEHEHFGNCPDDCKSGGKDRFCDKQADQICDPDCNPPKLDPDYPNCSAKSLTKGEIKDNNKKQTNQPQEQKQSAKDNTLFRIIIWISAIILVILIFLGYKKIRKI